MATSAKVGSFVKDATSGAHQQVISGLGFQPKGIIFFSNTATATGIGADVGFMIGLSDGTTNKSVMMSANDAVNSSAASSSLHSTSCISLMNNGIATIDTAGKIDSFNSDGFTIGWTTASTQQYIIGYFAFGGSDITDVKVSKHDPLGTLGVYSVTTIPFQPDFLFFLSGRSATGEGTTASTMGAVCWGATTGPSNCGFTGGAVESGRTTSDTWRKQMTAAPIMIVDPSTGSRVCDWSGFTSFDANGFTLGAPGNSQSTPDFFSLAVKGGTWDVGNFTQKTSTGTQNVATSGSIDPGVVLLSSANNTVNQATNTNFVAGCDISLGAADGTSERSIWVGATDNIVTPTTAPAKRDYSDTKAIRLITESAGGGTVNAEADFTAHQTGQFTLDWVTADSTGRLLWYIALQTAAATTPVSQDSIHKYNLLQNVSQTNIQKYSMRQYLVQTNIHKYTLRNFVAIATSIQKYSLRKFLAQTSIHKYSLRQFIAQASIQKYNLRAFLAQTSIHKYALRALVAAAISTHKYSMRQYIPQTSVHKYNLRRFITQASIQKYNIIKQILQSSIHKYSLRQYIVNSSVQKYTLRNFVAITASIQKYNLRRFISQTSIHKYTLRQFVAITASIQKYSLRQFLAQTSIHKYSLRQFITQSSIHKYTIIQVATVIQTSIHKYSLRQYILQTSIQKYHLRIFVAISTSIQKYNLRQNITQTSIQKYNLFRRVIISSIHKYSLRQYILQTNIQKYNARHYVQAGKAKLVIHIPLYIYPFHWIPGNEWQQVSDLIAANPDIEFIIKINPNSGPDTSQNSDFIAGLNILTAGSNALHMKILGYVYTSYGARAIADVKTDIDRYESFYGQYMRGIFLDEMEDDPGDETYYSDITAYAHSKNYLTWGNPGKNVNESYISGNTVDICQISETDGYPTSLTISNSTFNGTYPTNRFAIGIYNAATYDKTLLEDFATKAQYLFVTSDVGPNPYDTVSQYIDDLALHSRALLGSIQKYYIFNTIIQTSIQKYNILKTILQTSIHKYTLRNFVAITASIHKYHLFQLAIQTSIHKYNLRQNILAASIQKYHIIQVNQVIVALIAKYNLRQYVVSPSIQKYTLRNFVAITTNIHKYNLLKILLQSSIHKYTLRNVVAQSASIQKYNLRQLVSQASIQKYNLRVFVAISASIQKYNLRQNVIQTSIQKYNTIARVLATSIHKYNLLVENIVVAVLIMKYNIRQLITSALIQKYNLRVFVSLTSIQKYNLRLAVIQTSKQKYNIIARILSSSIHKYHMKQYIVSSSVHKYYILITVLQTAIHKYNLRQLAIQTTIQKYSIKALIASTSIHKYNMRQFLSLNNIHKYNLRQLITATSIQKYNVISVLLVLAQSIHRYSLRQYIRANSIHKYTLGILKRHLVSMFDVPGKAIENMKGSKLLQNFLKGEWPV